MKGTKATYTCIDPQQQLQLNDTVQITDQKFVRTCVGQSPWRWSRKAPYCGKLMIKDYWHLTD